MDTKIKTELVPITPEMEEYFMDYLRRHRLAVADCARKLLGRGVMDEKLYTSIARDHDRSKGLEPEYTPYVRRKWFEKETHTEFYRQMGDDVKAAIVHHVTTNPHHPEYWSSDYRGFETTAPCHVVDMPNDSVAEMICDWTAMGLEHGNTARDWYDKTRDTRWIFDIPTTGRIAFWLDAVEAAT